MSRGESLSRRVPVQVDLCPEGFSVWRGVSIQVGLSGGGSLARVGLCLEGVSVQRRATVQGRGREDGDPLPLDGMAHATEDITFPCGRLQ